jgi:hypothetical protein
MGMRGHNNMVTTNIFNPANMLRETTRGKLSLATRAFYLSGWNGGIHDGGSNKK